MVEAGVLKGRTLTSYPDPADRHRNDGGRWVDRDVVVDHKLVTSRNPSDLHASCAKTVQMFALAVDT